MSASTAPSVKSELLTLLRADSGLAGVQIDYADPGANIGQEQIFCGRTLQSEAPDALGGRSQREKYDLEVYVYVAQDGDNPQACEERCWALVARVESVVRANNGPQGALSAALAPGNGFLYMQGIDVTPFTFNGQRVTEGLCRIHVEAKK